MLLQATFDPLVNTFHRETCRQSVNFIDDKNNAMLLSLDVLEKFRRQSPLKVANVTHVEHNAFGVDLRGYGLQQTFPVKLVDVWRQQRAVVLALLLR